MKYQMKAVIIIAFCTLIAAISATLNFSSASGAESAQSQPAGLSAEQRAELEKTIPQLDSEDFKVRETATQKIKSFGLSVVPVLREIASGGKLSPEVKARIDLIIDSICPLSIRISPGRFQQDGSKTIELYEESQHFYVVLTNSGTKPINLWRSWCSWGYYNLSFEVTDENGKVVKVFKNPTGWEKNYPDFNILPPGDQMVIEVNLGEKIWKNSPLPPKGKSVKVKMKAVYSISMDDEAKNNQIWTGKISSPEETYTIFR